MIDEMHQQPEERLHKMMKMRREQKYLHFFRILFAAVMVLATANLSRPGIAEDGQRATGPSDLERVGQAAYFIERASPARPDLHAAVVGGLATGLRPDLPDDFLMTLREVAPGEGTILMWERTATKTAVAGAHISRFYMLVMPATTAEGKQKIPLTRGRQSRPDVYAIYGHTEIGWTPLFSCVGLAERGEVLLDRTSADRIEANIDLTFKVVEAVEWASSDYCSDFQIQDRVSFLRR